MEKDHSQEEKQCYLGVDVGSNAVRVVAIDQSGESVGSAVFPLVVHSPQPEFYEQSSNQIWAACCNAVKKVLYDCQLKPDHVRSICFDATCSMVILDQQGNPLQISASNAEQNNEEGSMQIWNVIMWMDHRAKKQADFINSTGHRCLRSVGQKISLEMQPPKLLWLKQNLPEVYHKAGQFMDLADFLTFKATGSICRSRCCVACKWMYQTDGEKDGFDHSFYETICLPKLVENNFWKIGAIVAKPGTPIDYGLTKEAADELGLLSRTPVAVGMIDAHAGCLGILFAKINDQSLRDLPVTNKLTMICGTSTCHMAFSGQPVQVEGVWGPYQGVVFPDLWLNEAGQSSVGPILQMVAESYGKLLLTVADEQKHEQRGNRTAHHPMKGHDFQSEILAKLKDYAKKHGHLSEISLAKNIHVWPDYHGNRSPLADPSMTGAVLGLRLESNVNKLEYCLSVYLAHVQAFALMTRFIVDTLTSSTKGQRRHDFKAIYLCGGLQRNHCYVQAHADACQLPVIVVDDARDEPVARGAAILGATASGDFASLEQAARALSPIGRLIKPRPEAKPYFDAKYAVFRKLGQFLIDVKNDEL